MVHLSRAELLCCFWAFRIGRHLLQLRKGGLYDNGRMGRKPKQPKRDRWPDYDTFLPAEPNTTESLSLDEMAMDRDTLWCEEAWRPGTSISEMAHALMERSPNAREKGEVYALETAKQGFKLASPVGPLGRIKLARFGEPRGIKVVRSSERSEVAAQKDVALQMLSVHTPELIEDGTELVAKDKRIITLNGELYVPVMLAAWQGQTSPSTIRRWVENRVVIAGKAIRTYVSPGKELYLAAESVDRIAKRFVRWPSNTPAGRPVVGLCDDRMGFLPLQEAADLLGTSKQTLWNWANKGKAASGGLLEVIKCPISDQLYVRHRDIQPLQDDTNDARKAEPKQRPLLSETRRNDSQTLKLQ
jgi:hypothetical protein